MKTFAATETKQKTSEILADLKKQVDVWCYWSDEELDKQFPVPKKITTRHFAYNIEADPELANKSAEDLGDMAPYATLRERLLLELLHFKKTGGHLDVENWTLCAGSRDADGRVPCVGWVPARRGLGVGWAIVRRTGLYLRARAAVNPLCLGDLNPELDLQKRVAALEATVKHYNLSHAKETDAA